MLNSVKLIVYATLVLLLSACDSNEKSEEQTITIKTSSSDVTFEDAKVRIDLYGFNSTVADISATRISSNIFSISGFPTSYKFSWPKDSHRLIKNPDVKEKENAKFYLRINIDSNDDGQICVDDYVHDASFYINIGVDQKIEAVVRPKSSYSCFPFSDNDINLAPFINNAKNIDCADISNRIFLINKEMVFWHRAGNCPDNGYRSALYGNSVTFLLAEQFDSIAGSQNKVYDESYHALFEKLTNNINTENLGLDNTYTVNEIIRF